MFDENQQKRIAFLSLHGHLMRAVKQEKELDGKKHLDMCQYIYAVVDNLFAKYPYNLKVEKPSKPVIEKVDVTPF